MDLSQLDRLPEDGSGVLHLNLFNDTNLTARFSNLDTVSTPARAWAGTLDENPLGTFTLVRDESGMAAIIRAPGKGVYEVRSSGDGTCNIREISAPDFRCESESGVATLAPVQVKNRSSTAMASPVQLGLTQQAVPPPASSLPVIYGCDDGSVIDIMIVYTAQARAAAGGTAAMQTDINLAITDVNAAFNRSGPIPTSLRLVYSYEVNYPDTGDQALDAARLLDPSDGLLDDVPPLRDFYGADCLSFWSHYNFIGFGYFPDGSLQGVGVSGLTFCDWRGYNGLLLGHEVGHNLWCAHQWGNGDATPLLEYAHGYIEPGNAWRDIMSSAAMPAIPYYANPNIIWPGPNPPNPGPTGVPIGQQNPSDVATAIGQTRHIIANFRATAVPDLPSVIYVKASAPAGGNGLSWGTALRDLQDALCKAAGSRGAVQQIWVAAGTYKPDRGSNDRTASFNLQNNLAIYGGFAGNETNLNQRNIAANVTTLSGDIGAAGNNTDNSYHVVRGYNVGSTARLDGFTITAANANLSNQPTIHGDGGGMRLEGASATIANCTFASNNATNVGGGVECINGANAAFSSCTFSNNSAGVVGGGAHTYQSSPGFTNCNFNGNSAQSGGGLMNQNASTPTLSGCNFTGNSADSGGAIRNYGCSPPITNCTFTNNTAVTNAGAIENILGSSPALSGCQFTGNMAASGGAVLNFSASHAAFSLCTFTNNTATNGGGGITNNSSTIAATNCQFNSNHANAGAGVYNIFDDTSVYTQCSFTGNTSGWASGMYNVSATPRVIGCTFAQNTSTNGAGAFANYQAAAVVRDTVFIGNNAGWGGAAVNDASTGFFANCKFLGNTATAYDSGAVEVWNSGPTFVNCLFSGNQAQYGGAIGCLSGSTSAQVVNCTFSRNKANSSFGGAIVLDAPSIAMTNTVFWGNTGTGTTQQNQFHAFSGTGTFSRCIVQGWTGSLGGIGNNASNPLFVDDDGADNIVGTIDDNVRLGGASPAIDTGDSAALPPDTADLDADGNTAEVTSLDLDAHPRILASAVDRGAYELVPNIPADFDHDGDVDDTDRAHFVACATRSFIAQVNPACTDAKLDVDTDVDMNDYTILQRCYSGSQRAAQANCAN